MKESEMTWEEIITTAEKQLAEYDEIVVRFTDDPAADQKRGVSFLDWGIAPEDTQEACEDEYPQYTAVYDETAGGWLPALPGLCGFHDYDVETVVVKARKFSAKDAYKSVIVAPGRYITDCWDGDVISVGWEHALVFDNPDF
ncbi:MAG: hypothetical protein D6694_12265 [Gammaproteobacteria bacterium]|nr:MAG: hypothetical protein D6694_12265 [Gammaproteobacteria bacterium]